MRLDPRHHTIIATGVASSGAGDDAAPADARRDLRAVLENTLRRQNLEPDDLTPIAGGGFRLLLPVSVPPQAALAPFTHRLGTELRMRRHGGGEAPRQRLRVAVHRGPLSAGPGDRYAGPPLTDVARLLDADAGRELLTGHPAADLVLLVSPAFYDDVVRPGAALDPALFQRVTLRAGAGGYGWAYLPGIVPQAAAPARARPLPAPGAPRRRPERRRPGSGIFHGPWS